MSQSPLIGDFHRRRVSLVAANSRATNLDRAIWVLVGALAIALVLAALFVVHASDQGSSIADQRTQMLDAREALTLATQAIRESESLPENFFAMREEIIESANDAGLEDLTVEQLRAALDELGSSQGQPLPKPAVSAFVDVAETGLEQLSALNTQLQRQLERARSRLLLEASLLILVTLAGLAGALHILRGALRDQRMLLTTASDEVERLSAVLAASADGIVIVDTGGRVLAANARAYAMLGIAPGSLVDTAFQDWIEFTGIDAPNGEFAKQARTIISREDALLETAVRRGNGATFPASITLAEYHDGDGQRFVATVRDISKRREEEAAKEAFVSTVTHELRTPLTSISGSLDLLVSKGLGPGTTPQAQRLVEIAQSNAHRLIRLINDILDIEKLEAGRTSLDIVELSLRSIAETAIEANAEYASPKSVTFRLNMLEPEVVVHGDRDRLMQVANNLLSNAVKASPGGAIVEVSVLRTAGWGEFAVRDYGPGVPAAFEPELFKKFAQAEKGTGSTGLGLALVNEIAEQLGGRAYYQRALPRGSIFTVALRLADLDMPADTCQTDAVNIVHVDPDPDALRVVAHAFGDRAHVRSFVGLLEARDALRLHGADSILIDVTAFKAVPLQDLIKVCEGVPVVGFSSDEADAAPAALLSANFVKSRDSLERMTRMVLQISGASPVDESP